MAKVEIDLEKITSEMDELKKNQAYYKFELKNIEKEIEKRELQLVALLGQMDVKSMDYGIYSFGYVERQRTAFDQSLFKEENPEIFNKYYLTKTREDFVFKING